MTIMVQLTSNENEKFSVELAAVKKSITIKDLLENLGVEENNDGGEEIPLPNVDTKTLTKIIDYLNYHKDDPEPSTTTEEEESLEKLEVPDWDAEFLKVSIIFQQNNLFYKIISKTLLTLLSI